MKKSILTLALVASMAATGIQSANASAMYDFGGYPTFTVNAERTYQFPVATAVDNMDDSALVSLIDKCSDFVNENEELIYDEGRSCEFDYLVRDMQRSYNMGNVDHLYDLYEDFCDLMNDTFK